MPQSLQALLATRYSANHFDPQHMLTEQEVQDLIALATRAPSAFNQQNWRFVAVVSAQGKQQLLSLSFGQQKVVDAAVTFIVCGTQDGYRQLSRTLQAAVNQGVLPLATAAGWVEMAGSHYRATPQACRDEAVRSASLAAMALMLAAQEQGLASCPMTGFDVAGVQQAFGLGEHALPVMLLPVGRAAAGNWPQKPRKPVAEVLQFA